MYSDCCGAEDTTINGDSSFSDFGLCPDCLEHCEFVEEYEEELFNSEVKA